MKTIFADTSGWANFFLRTEPFHIKAKKLMTQWHSNKIRIITTNYIISELVALFTSPLKIPRFQQIKIVETIKTVPWVDIVHITPVLDEKAWVLIKERPDKTWSLVDCASFVVMRQYDVSEAFTSDHHFEQAGFFVMLK
jgi:predicted nucleic acid-binding protein